MPRIPEETRSKSVFSRPPSLAIFNERKLFHHDQQMKKKGEKISTSKIHPEVNLKKIKFEILVLRLILMDFAKKL